MATKPKESKGKRPGFLQWFIVILIPLLFALLITIIILNVMGIDISKHTKETFNKIPFIEEYITTDEEEVENNQIEQKEETITNQVEEMEALEYKLQSKDDEISSLEEQISNLSEQIATLEASQEEAPVNSDAYKEMSKSFTEMKAKTAAPILENMDNGIAIKLLKEIDTEARGDILGEMSPEVAADYTKQIVNE